MPYPPVFPPILACVKDSPSPLNFSAGDILTFIGWFASAVFGYWVATRLDRKHSINGVRAQIEMIRDLVEASEDGETSYKATFEDLRKAVFASIPLFSKSRQKEIISAWAAYRALDFRMMSDVNFTTSVLDALGHEVTFKHKAVLSALADIERHIK